MAKKEKKKVAPNRASKKSSKIPPKSAHMRKMATATKKATRPVPKRPSSVKKPAARKPIPVKKLPPVKPAVRKPVDKSAPAAKLNVKTVRVLPEQPAPVKKSPLSRKELEEFRKLLLNLRDSIVDEISFLAGENLNGSQRDAAGDLSNYSLHMADQGTDNFNREFALNLVSNEQDVLHEIDEALQRVDARTFGVCEKTGQLIETERLKVLPYTRLCRTAQEEQERGSNKRRRTFNGSTSFGSGGQDY